MYTINKLASLRSSVLCASLEYKFIESMSCDRWVASLFLTTTKKKFENQFDRSNTPPHKYIRIQCDLLRFMQTSLLFSCVHKNQSNQYLNLSISLCIAMWWWSISISLLFEDKECTFTDFCFSTIINDDSNSSNCKNSNSKENHLISIDHLIRM